MACLLFSYSKSTSHVWPSSLSWCRCIYLCIDWSGSMYYARINSKRFQVSKYILHEFRYQLIIICQCLILRSCHTSHTRTVLFTTQFLMCAFQGRVDFLDHGTCNCKRGERGVGLLCSVKFNACHVHMRGTVAMNSIRLTSACTLATKNMRCRYVFEY